MSYKDFANAKFSALLPIDKINDAYKKQVFELASCYYENLGDNRFKRHELPLMAQISSVNDISIEDFNIEENYHNIIFKLNGDGIIINLTNNFFELKFSGIDFIMFFNSNIGICKDLLESFFQGKYEMKYFNDKNNRVIFTELFWEDDLLSKYNRKEKKVFFSKKVKNISVKKGYHLG